MAQNAQKSQNSQSKKKVDREIINARRRLVKSVQRNIAKAQAAQTPAEAKRYEFLAAQDAQMVAQTYANYGIKQKRKATGLEAAVNKALKESRKDAKKLKKNLFGKDKNDAATALGLKTSEKAKKEKKSDKRGIEFEQAFKGKTGKQLLNSWLSDKDSSPYYEYSRQAIINRSQLSKGSRSAKVLQENEARSLLNNSITGSRILGGLVDVWRDKATVQQADGTYKVDNSLIVPAILDYFQVDTLSEVIEKLEVEFGDSLYSTKDDLEVIYQKIMLAIQAKVASGFWVKA